MWPSLWKFVLRRLAKAKGFLDPTVVFSNLQRFSKPSEVWVPVELLRSGAVLQARGLVNSQAIQHNLDWIWPFWVEKQFNPKDKAFIPRAFSLTHINLTHRNWTAVGLPGFSDFPIVDPRGLVTPFFDGWSLEAWVLYEGKILTPAALSHVHQELDLRGTFAVTTKCAIDKFTLEARTEVTSPQAPVCKITFHVKAAQKASLMICVRPYNPEGVSFIRDLELLEKDHGWSVNKKEKVYLDRQPHHYLFANYSSGDLGRRNDHVTQDVHSVTCPTGMATSAAIYDLGAGRAEQVTVSVPLEKKALTDCISWSEHQMGVCALKIPDPKMQFLYEAAVKTIVLHSPGDIYPGPFTYKRFWFRDAAFILQAMTTIGLFKNIDRIIDRFPLRQTPTGYFMSQDGEWDSNGQAIWAIKRYLDTTQIHAKNEWIVSIYKAAKWIERKRYFSQKDPLHNGLLPAGFSAEHFGPSDFYYWDDFWAIAGLRDASLLAQKQQNSPMADDFIKQADDLLQAVEKSIAAVEQNLAPRGIPASASRRMDAGAIGALVASYPLQIYGSNDERMLTTAKFLMDKYFLQGAFFHEISHSGLNIYLTLHLAQVLLRAGDIKFFDIVESVAALATPTGQWPEAIHPRTMGGCMGDGQHVWACAEFAMILRNMFVREEIQTRTIILCSGIPDQWMKPHETFFMGPIYTLYGEISVNLKVTEEYVHISWQAQWHETVPKIEISLPGHEKIIVKENITTVRINLKEVMVH